MTLAVGQYFLNMSYKALSNKRLENWTILELRTYVNEDNIKEKKKASHRVRYLQYLYPAMDLYPEYCKNSYNSTRKGSSVEKLPKFWTSILQKVSEWLRVWKTSLNLLFLWEMQIKTSYSDTIHTQQKGWDASCYKVGVTVT